MRLDLGVWISTVGCLASPAQSGGAGTGGRKVTGWWQKKGMRIVGEQAMSEGKR